MLNVGGNFNDNVNYGVFYFNANNDASATNGNTGSRLLYPETDIPWRMTSLAPWQKYLRYVSTP